MAQFDLNSSMHVRIVNTIYVQFKVQLDVLFYVFFVLLYS
jgi:hypothetical protein